MQLYTEGLHSAAVQVVIPWSGGVITASNGH